MSCEEATCGTTCRFTIKITLPGWPQSLLSSDMETALMDESLSCVCVFVHIESVPCLTVLAWCCEPI